MRTHLGPGLVGLVGAAFIASCAKAPPSIHALAPPSIVGDWSVVAVNGRPSSGVASIRPPMYSISFGCNNGRSAIQVNPERLIIVGAFGSTERGCGDELERREAEGFRIAARTMQTQFFGPQRLRLSNPAGTIDLVRH